MELKRTWLGCLSTSFKLGIVVIAMANIEDRSKSSYLAALPDHNSQGVMTEEITGSGFSGFPIWGGGMGAG